MDQQAVGQRVKQRRDELNMSQEQLARLSGLKQATISSLERGRSKTTGNIGTIANALGVNAVWLQTGLGSAGISEHARIQVMGEQTLFPIEIVASRGSCGTGAVGRPDVDDLAKQLGPILKDQAFFSRLNVTPDEVFAVLADGDGMSNFIVHGDTVLFAANNTDRFEHGHIYALQTPDGPRIKRVLRKTDGQVILSNDNPDKIRFPDEVYSPEEAGRLDNIGRFIFRQG